MAFDPETAGRSLAESLRRHRTSILLGSVVGLFTGGPAGLVMGGLFGYFASRLLLGAVKAFHPQRALFKATFSVMGKVAKADGRVSENEIAFASALMNQMRLTGEKRQEAIDQFNAGKEADFDIAEALKPLAVYLRHRPDVRMFFVEVQLQAAFADGEVSAAELEVIQQNASLEYTRFDGGIFGAPGKNFSSSMGISVSNNIEAKVKDKDSTATEPKKVMLLNNLNFSTSFNSFCNNSRFSLSSAFFFGHQSTFTASA